MSLSTYCCNFCRRTSLGGYKDSFKRRSTIHFLLLFCELQLFVANKTLLKTFPEKERNCRLLRRKSFSRLLRTRRRGCAKIRAKFRSRDKHVLSLKVVVFPWFNNKYDKNKSIKTIYIFFERRNSFTIWRIKKFRSLKF